MPSIHVGAGNAVQARVRFHVLLSTYEMVLSEASELKRVSWAAQVVDEGHRLRNRHSKAFQVRPAGATPRAASVSHEHVPVLHMHVQNCHIVGSTSCT